MTWSLKLVTVRGIPVRVHLTFVLVLLWAVFWGLQGGGSADWPRGVALTLAFVLLLFACVVLHELGHSLVAQLFGVQVQDITLWPIGGVARMAKMPEQPHQEFLIAAAGPATNILIAIILAALALAWMGPQATLSTISYLGWLNPFASDFNGQSLLLLLAFYNVSLALFNLLPAFPMDGGRLLRALLAAVVPFPRATQIAASLGQVLASFMAVIALATGNYLLALVGLFVFLAAWQERQRATSHASLRGLRVRQAMQPIGLQLHPLQTLGEAAAQVSTSSQSAYLVVDAGRLAGVLSRRTLLAALKRAGPAARVAQHVQRDVIRFSPDTLLTDAQDRLAAEPAAIAVVLQDGQVIGTVSRLDLLRLAETLDVYPNLLPRE